jgi:drug/metabolite transporter (DMT)-like permease
MHATPRTLLLTLLALLAFAANSLLCRAALRDNGIDAASFTGLRLASGAAMLCLLLTVRCQSFTGLLQRQSITGGALLFVYAAGFSFAYLQLGAATGALVLFATVQLSMLAVGIVRGERPGTQGWVGIALACLGLAALLLPGLQSPPLRSVLLMALAGLAWAGYSLRGQTGADALQATAGSFLLSLPPAALLLLFALPDARIDANGAVLAIASGALASGLGYAIWYRALPGLTATQAATVQLSVPLLAALGGIALLGESMSLRLLLAAAGIVLGIAAVIYRRALR